MWMDMNAQQFVAHDAIERKNQEARNFRRESELDVPILFFSLTHQARAVPQPCHVVPCMLFVMVISAVSPLCPTHVG